MRRIGNPAEFRTPVCLVRRAAVAAPCMLMWENFLTCFAQARGGKRRPCSRPAAALTLLLFAGCAELPQDQSATEADRRVAAPASPAERERVLVDYRSAATALRH